MKIAALIARILLGLVFFVFGLNGFFLFIKMGPMPSGLAGDFAGALFKSHYMLVVSAVQTLGGLLLLVGRYIPLGLTLLGPVIVNILCFHLFLSHTDFLLPVLVTLFWGIVTFRYRKYFSGLFVQKAE